MIWFLLVWNVCVYSSDPFECHCIHVVDLVVILLSTLMLQAILGGSVQVPTLTGDVLLKIRPGTQPGQKQVLRGKGVRVLNSRHYGDQYVQINVVIPMNITHRQRQIIEEFAREESGETESVAAEGSG